MVKVTQEKFKTELCRNVFNEYGEMDSKLKCRFGRKCIFAHNLNELQTKVVHQKFKTMQCIKFSNGYCPYGNRCSFIHAKPSTNAKLETEYNIKISFHDLLNLDLETIPRPSTRLQVFINLTSGRI